MWNSGRLLPWDKLSPVVVWKIGIGFLRGVSTVEIGQYIHIQNSRREDLVLEGCMLQRRHQALDRL